MKIKKIALFHPEKYTPNYWFFQSHTNKGKVHRRTTGARNTIKKRANCAHTEQNVINILGHLFAPHIEQRIYLRHMQNILHHSSGKTTGIDTCISKKSLTKTKIPLRDVFNNNKQFNYLLFRQQSGKYT